MKYKKLLVLVLLALIAGFMGAMLATTNLSLRGYFSEVRGRMTNSEKKWVNYYLTAYLESWKTGDLDGMYSALDTSVSRSLNKKELEELFDSISVKPLAYEIESIVVTGEQAEAKVLVSWPNINLDGMLQHTETFLLIKRGSTWKIREDFSMLD